jgi:hypothetical protein
VNPVSSGQRYDMMIPSLARMCWATNIPSPGLSVY